MQRSENVLMWQEIDPQQLPHSKNQQGVFVKETDETRKLVAHGRKLMIKRAWSLHPNISNDALVFHGTSTAPDDFGTIIKCDIQEEKGREYGSGFYTTPNFYDAAAWINSATGFVYVCSVTADPFFISDATYFCDSLKLDAIIEPAIIVPRGERTNSSWTQIVFRVSKACCLLYAAEALPLKPDAYFLDWGKARPV